MMNKLKIWVTTVLSIAVMGFCLAAPASAAVEVISGCDKVPDSAVCEASKGRNLFGTNSVWSRILNTLIFIVGAASVIFIVIGGIRYATSNGDQSQITQAKNTILYAVIGLVVAIAAQAIVAFVVQRIG